jgi:hypothetical protein
VDLFLTRVDELWFVLLLYQLVQLPSAGLVTPFGSCFFVLVIPLGILHFVFWTRFIKSAIFPPKALAASSASAFSSAIASAEGIAMCNVLGSPSLARASTQ